jgi:mannose-binding lectin 2
VEFEFKVHGSAAKIHGDGFAFWYTTESKKIGPVFGNEEFFTGLGIFFDTYPNARKGVSNCLSFLPAFL